MKTISIYASAAVMALFLASCGGGGNNSEAPAAAETQEETTAEDLLADDAQEITWTIDAANSKVEWKGTMIGVYDHFGTINLTEGSIIQKGENFVGGSFTVDMNSINPTDENYSDEHPASDLVGHLGSADFFDVANNPTAGFEITGTEGTSVMGNLTLRGTTDTETVTDVVVDQTNGTITGKMIVDRQKYGVAWTNPKDAVLSDDLEMMFTLKLMTEETASAESAPE